MPHYKRTRVVSLEKRRAPEALCTRLCLVGIRVKDPEDPRILRWIQLYRGSGDPVEDPVVREDPVV